MKILGTFEFRGKFNESSKSFKIQKSKDHEVRILVNLDRLAPFITINLVKLIGTGDRYIAQSRVQNFGSISKGVVMFNYLCYTSEIWPRSWETLTFRVSKHSLPPGSYTKHYRGF